MVATAAEIGSAIEITSISWQRGTTGNASSATFNDFNIYLGYCPDDLLGTEFDDNYVPGSRTLVHHNDAETVTADPDDWFTIVLDSPFWYNGVDNLIMEVTWASGLDNPSVYEFNTPMTPVSLKAADPLGDSGFLSSMRCQFILEGTSTLQMETFGSIKVRLGS